MSLKNPEVCLPRKISNSPKPKPVLSYYNNRMKRSPRGGCNLASTSPFCLALAHIWVWGPGSFKRYRTENNTVKKEAECDCYVKNITDETIKTEGLAPLVLIISSFKRTTILGFEYLASSVVCVIELNICALEFSVYIKVMF